MVKVYGLYCKEEPNEVQLNLFFHSIDQQKRNRIIQYRNYKEMKKTLLSDVLVRSIACHKLKIANADLTFSFNRYGKPFFDNLENTFKFNISHSGDWIVCAIDHLPIGIDIEKMRRINYISLAKSCFSKIEYETIIAQPTTKQSDYFFELWTLKESYIKALGKGLILPLDSFTVTKNATGWFEINSNLIDTINPFLKQLYLDSEYKLAVCSFHPILCDAVIIKDYVSLSKELLLVQN